MDSDRQKRLFGNSSPRNSFRPLSKSASQSNEQTSDIVERYQLSCELDEALERMVRGFLEEVSEGGCSGPPKSENLVALIQDLIVYARYQRYDAECWRKEAGKLSQMVKCLPQSIAGMEKRLADIKLERRVVLADLRGIKKRRRNKRRRR